MEGVGDGVRVSVFDDSVEKHFKAMETISKLCGEPELPFSPDDTEIQRLSSSVTFFREWRELQYKPRTIRFTRENEKAGEKGSATSGVVLRQFSSAAVPQEEDGPNGPATSARMSKDFVMYVGGSVWALDWCPRNHVKPDHPFKYAAALPRIVLCLAHSGKVVWDLKWRHPGAYESKCHYQMGYLAVLLGNGSLEVWDVPLPHSMKWLYDSSLEEETDPRFVKLQPVFRCSRLKGGGMQSIPLAVEWSNHDYLLVGCHDGTVALWKFSTTGSSEDTRPLLCFSADTIPIRAVAWAPTESHQQSANIILTAGHNGLKFWDIRDPFRPLWDLHPAPKFIYSLDWLRDPNCIILAFDDGTLRLLSLVKAAYDAPVHGNPTIRPKQHGLHILKYSSFATWSVQVSRHTGMVAYCNADGMVSRFQLTRKAVEKQPGRYRAHHFLCGFLSEEELAITVNTPQLVAPVSSKKQVDNVGNDSKLTHSLSKPTQDKATNGGEADGSSLDNQLAICYGEEFGGENESESNLKSGTREEDVDDRAVVWGEGEQEEIVEKGAVKKVDTMPAKMVAMHRVRWNMNKGSERWLCSGGAAGIVRCQEIILTDYDGYMARKR